MERILMVTTIATALPTVGVPAKPRGPVTTSTPARTISATIY